MNPDWLHYCDNPLVDIIAGLYTSCFCDSLIWTVEVGDSS